MMGMGEPLYNFEAVRDALLIVATTRHRYFQAPDHAIDVGRGAQHRCAPAPRSA
jgi:hypothetical protein